MTTVPDDVEAFIRSLWQLTDRTGDGEPDYLHYYAPDIKLAMGDKEINGHAELAALRKEGWRGVDRRQHTLEELYAHPTDDSRWMMHGTVRYWANGRELPPVKFAVRFVLDRKPGKTVITEYYAWLVGTRDKGQ